MSIPNEEDPDLAPTQTEGYKLSQAQSLQHYSTLDQEDESLNKWKASLGITASSTSTTPSVSLPLSRAILVISPHTHDLNIAQVTILSLSLSSADLATPIEFNFPQDGANLKIDETKFPLVTIKEGIDYDVQVKFFVTGAVVSGLRYIQVVKRAGIKGSLSLCSLVRVEN